MQCFINTQNLDLSIVLKNRIGACTRGLASRADLAVRVVRGRNLFIPPLVGAASRFA